MAESNRVLTTPPQNPIWNFNGIFDGAGSLESVLYSVFGNPRGPVLHARETPRWSEVETEVETTLHTRLGISTEVCVKLQAVNVTDLVLLRSFCVLVRTLRSEGRSPQGPRCRTHRTEETRDLGCSHTRAPRATRGLSGMTRPRERLASACECVISATGRSREIVKTIYQMCEIKTGRSRSPSARSGRRTSSAHRRRQKFRWILGSVETRIPRRTHDGSNA